MKMLEDLEEVVRLMADGYAYDHQARKAWDLIRTHAAEIQRNARDAAIMSNARIHLTTKVETHKLGDYSPEEMAAFDCGYNMALGKAHNLLNRYPGAIAAIDTAMRDGGGE